jgi:uncharacterized protein (TIGR02271 family)
MVQSKSGGSQRRRFSIQEHLGDPEVRKGYEEQGAVIEAAHLIRQMREAAGLSQEALANRLGTSQSHLSALENGTGRQGPTFLMLSRIAEASGQKLQISAKASPLGAATHGTTAGTGSASLGSETRDVDKRDVQRGTARLRRHVVERPVEEQVRLRDEAVSIERRPVSGSVTVAPDAFAERTVKVTETAEEGVVSKSARAKEEVVINKDVSEGVGAVRGTARREGVTSAGNYAGEQAREATRSGASTGEKARDSTDSEKATRTATGKQ